jgi:hypothetical protein
MTRACYRSSRHAGRTWRPPPPLRYLFPTCSPLGQKRRLCDDPPQGVSLCEMLTKRLPWGEHGGSAQAVLAAAMSRLIHPAKTLAMLYPAGHFPFELQHVVSQMLATDPKLRLADAREALQELQQVAMAVMPQALHPALISSKMSAQQLATLPPAHRRSWEILRPRDTKPLPKPGARTRKLYLGLGLGAVALLAVGAWQWWARNPAWHPDPKLQARLTHSPDATGNTGTALAPLNLPPLIGGDGPAPTEEPPPSGFTNPGDEAADTAAGTDKPAKHHHRRHHRKAAPTE